MRGFNSLSGGKWDKPPRAVFLSGIQQVDGGIPLKETNHGAILKLGEAVGVGVG